MAGLQTGVRPLLQRILFSTLLFFLMADKSQEQDCNVFKPSRYIYPSGDILNPGRDSESCSTQNINGNSYFVCSEGRLVNEDPGPPTFDRLDSSYYHWNVAGGKMLFVFPTVAEFTSIILHFYIDDPNTIARPKLKIIQVDDSFEINDPIPTVGTPTAIDRLDRQSLQDRLYNETVPLTETGIPPTNKVLLFVFGNKLYNFAITEITFCTTEHVMVPTTIAEPSSTAPITNGTVIVATSFTVPFTGTVKKETDIPLRGISGGQRQNQLSLFTIVFISLILLLR